MELERVSDRCDQCDRRMVIAVAVLAFDGQREEKKFCWPCWRKLEQAQAQEPSEK